jgi:hypothetical protein
LPTAAEATKRAESWLRERQASVGGEVLVITGRGKGSDAGVAVVRPAVQQRLAHLQRQGVVSEVHEHTPGSFVVALASMSELTAATRHTTEALPAARVAPEFANLEPATAAALRTLASYALDSLGAPRTEALITDEMGRQFSRLATVIGSGPNRESRLRDAIAAALNEIDD